MGSGGRQTPERSWAKIRGAHIDGGVASRLVLMAKRGRPGGTRSGYENECAARVAGMGRGRRCCPGRTAGEREAPSGLPVPRGCLRAHGASVACRSPSSELGRRLSAAQVALGQLGTWKDTPAGRASQRWEGLHWWRVSSPTLGIKQPKLDVHVMNITKELPSSELEWQFSNLIVLQNLWRSLLKAASGSEKARAPGA